MKRRLIALVCCALFLLSPLAAQQVRFTLLQINDVYEITPLEGGQAGAGGHPLSQVIF